MYSKIIYTLINCLINMYSCKNETAEYLTQLCSIYKKKTFKIFSIEMEKYSFGNKYNEAKNVYANKNGDYGYYESTDFKEINIVLKKGMNYLHLITNEEEKALVKAFLEQGIKLRNDVWHNTIKVNNMEKNYNQVLILQKLVDIIKKNYTKEDKVFSSKDIKYINTLIDLWEPKKKQIPIENTMLIDNEEEIDSIDDEELEDYLEK